MKIPRLPAPSWPLPPPPAVRPSAGASTPAPGAPGSAPRSLDTAAGLRIFVEEVRLAVVEQLGRRAGLAAPAVPEEGPAEAAARLLAFLRAASGAASNRDPASLAAALQKAVAAGAERALTAVAARPGVAPGVDIAIEEARAQVVALLPKARPPDLPARAAQVLVEQVRAAVEERLGMLPRSLPADPAEGPAEALVAVSRLFGAVVSDPVLGVRASPFALAQALDQGAARAAALLATGKAGAEAARIVEDLRAVLARDAVTVTAARATPAASRPVAALSLLANELRLVLAESGAARPAPVDAQVPLETQRVVGMLVRALAEAAGQWGGSDPRASRAAAEATLDVALRRALLQLPAAERAPLAALLREVHVDATRLLLAAETVAGRGAAVPAGWTGPALEAAVALLKGQEPPFRFDLAALPATRLRRRKSDRGNHEGVEAIETTEPEEPEEPPPLEWPRLPE